MLGDIVVQDLANANVALELRTLCQRHHVKRLKVFGSTLHGTAGPGSDLDIIVEFYTGMTPGFAFARLGDELSSLLGRNIDLHTAGSLSRYFRDEVLREAQVIYAGEE
jgi:predicted nucleotidyltransferase